MSSLRRWWRNRKVRVTHRVYMAVHRVDERCSRVDLKAYAKASQLDPDLTDWIRESRAAYANGSLTFWTADDFKAHLAELRAARDEWRYQERQMRANRTAAIRERESCA